MLLRPTQIIFSEDAARDIDLRLRNYTYDQSLKDHKPRGASERLDNNQRAEVAASVLQGLEYLKVGRSVSLHTGSVQLHYATVSLLRAAVLLVKAELAPIKGHGMDLGGVPPATPLGGTNVWCRAKHDGALVVLGEALLDGDRLLKGGPEQWLLRDLLGSIPDIRATHVRCYGLENNLCVPVERVRTPTGAFLDRIPLDLVAADILGRVIGDKWVKATYLNPQRTEKHLVLRPQLGKVRDITVEALSGQRFIRLGHTSLGAPLPELISFLASLFILSSVSRYYVRTWDEVVGDAISLERQLVQEFLIVSARRIPNLVLDHIEDVAHVFTSQREGPVDLREPLTKADVKKLVREELREVISLLKKGNV